MSCEERERLAKIYIAAVAKNNKSARVVAEAYREGRRDEWRQEMMAIRATCQEALYALDKHLAIQTKNQAGARTDSLISEGR
jgi:hypothetical protein